MIRLWHGIHWGEHGEERSCLIVQILDESERAVDLETGDPVVGPYLKLPNED